MRFFVFMRLKINGETIENFKSATLAELIEELKIEKGRVAVEVNLSVVKKTEYGSFRLKDGDTIEIVNFVGGGSNKEQHLKDKGRCSIFTHSLFAPRFCLLLYYDIFNMYCRQKSRSNTASAFFEEEKKIKDL